MASGYSDNLKLPSVITQGITQYDDTGTNSSCSVSDSDPRSDSDSDSDSDHIITPDESVSIEGGTTASTLIDPEIRHTCYEVLLGQAIRP